MLVHGTHILCPCAKPSSKDILGIKRFFDNQDNRGQHQIVMIVGYSSRNSKGNELGVYLFDRALLRRSKFLECSGKSIQGGTISAPDIEPIKKTIGLALSGGGSRAGAFHLGTLRALEDLQLLGRVNVLSGVSGGAVIAGMLGYSHGPFATFEKKAIGFLRRGLVKHWLWKMAHPARFTRIIAAFISVVLPTLVFDVVRTISIGISGIFPRSTVFCKWLRKIQWPVRRWYSRTHAMADAIADVVGNSKCDVPTRNGMDVVLNSCELRTGTAFRISNREFGSWRLGMANSGQMRLADAVAASAAYPPLLPPFDWQFSFTRKGRPKSKRVIVTDGGVFENLGVSVMEPGRDTSISSISFNPDVIVVSDAGEGQFILRTPQTGWPSRMANVGRSPDEERPRLNKGSIAQACGSRADQLLCLYQSWSARRED